MLSESKTYFSAQLAPLFGRLDSGIAELARAEAAYLEAAIVKQGRLVRSSIVAIAASLVFFLTAGVLLGFALVESAVRYFPDASRGAVFAIAAGGIAVIGLLLMLLGYHYTQRMGTAWRQTISHIDKMCDWVGSIWQ